MGNGGYPDHRAFSAGLENKSGQKPVGKKDCFAAG